MSRAAFYVAAPLSPGPDGDIHRNLDVALAWLRWLRTNHPSIAFAAPWIASVLSGAEDSDPHQRELGLADCLATCWRFDALVAVGGRWSAGMLREKHVMDAQGSEVFDLTILGVSPPDGFVRLDASPSDLEWIAERQRVDREKRQRGERVRAHTHDLAAAARAAVERGCDLTSRSPLWVAPRADFEDDEVTQPEHLTELADSDVEVVTRIET